MPSAMDESTPDVYTRSSCHIRNLSQRFVSEREDYDKQYSNIYFVRSQMMKEKLQAAARKKWGDDLLVKSLSDIKCGEKCCIIGIIFKIMELQPNILKEVSDEHHLQLQPSRSRFTSETDKLVLEDEVQRISLVGNIDPQTYFTGSVVALLGQENTAGQFFVDEITYAGLPPQKEIPEVKFEQDKFVLFISGLEIGSKKEKAIEMQLLIDFVLGMLGGSTDNELSSQIIHIIIAGNSLSGETQDKESQKMATYLTYKAEATTVEAMNNLDFFLSQLVPSVSVDIMGGEFDPTNHVLPQNPLHPCMFPNARRYHGETFQTVTNPYECTIDGVNMLGTSGQNINNLKMFSNIKDSIQLLSDTIHCQHIAPTAPDTLGCYPFYKSDPFIISKCPNIYFCGNQDKYSAHIETGDDGQKVLLLSVPTFVNTSSAALVNIETYECQEVYFNATWN